MKLENSHRKQSASELYVHFQKLVLRKQSRALRNAINIRDLLYQADPDAGMPMPD
jgi:hypothetical protein